MKKLLTFLVILGVIGGGLYFGGNYLLTKFSKQGLSYVTDYLKTEGIDLAAPTFGSAHFSSWNAATWKDLSANFSSPKAQRKGQALQFSGNASAVTLTLMPGTVELKIEGADGGPSGNASDLDANRMKLDQLKVEVPISIGAPEAMVGRLLETAGELFKFIEDGKTAIVVEGNGKATFLLGDRPSDLRFEIGKRGPYYSMLINRQDLEEIASHFSDPLTPSEFELLAEYPTRAPVLFQIKKKAENTSSSAHREDPTVPEDAYRHVTWSYLLTKQYDPEFAEQVTDAHEVGSTTNTEADHRMDYNNNKVGRGYAAKGVVESDILNLVLTDPAVIKSAEFA